MNHFDSDTSKSTNTVGRRQFIFTFADNVAHNLCCQIRADDNSSTCTFTAGKSVVLMEHNNVLPCFNCTSHITNFGYADYFQ